MALILASVIVITFVNPLILVLNTLETTLDPVIGISFSYVLLFACIIILQFVFASLAINERFKTLNSLLR